jgi:ferredoxin
MSCSFRNLERGSLAEHKVTLLPAEKTINVLTGTLISEAIQGANLEIGQPCGGQGRCGRCAVELPGGL